MTGPEYLAFLRARQAPVRPATRARALINKLRTGRYKHNAEIMELCHELELRLHAKPEPLAKPDRSGYRNKNQYYKLYMRWYREQNGTHL